MPNYETKNNTQGGVDLDTYIAEREAAESANSESGLSDLDTYIAEREKQESANSESKLSDLDAYIAEREKQDAIDNQYNADRQTKLDELAVKAEAINKAKVNETTQREINSLDADKAIAMDATSSDYKYSTKEEKLAKLQEKLDALSSAKDKYDDSFTNTLINAKDGLVHGLDEGYQTINGLGDAAFTRVTDTVGNVATFFGDAVSNKFKKTLAKKKELDTIGEEAYIAKLKKEHEGDWFGPPMTTERAKLHVDYLNDMDEAVNSERAETVKMFGDWISSFTKGNEFSKDLKEHQAERKKKRTSGGSINIFSGEGRMEDKINNLSDMAGSMVGDVAMMAANAPLAAIGVMANTERDYMENGRKMGLTDEELNENKAPIIAFSTALAVLGDKLKIGDASSKAVNKIMGKTIESSLTKLKSAVSPRVYNAITKSLGTMTEAGFSGATEYGESIIPTLSHRYKLEKTGRFSKEDIAKKTKIDNMYDSPDFWVAALMGGAVHAKDSLKSYKESDGWKNVEAQLDNMANAETSKQALEHEAKMDENVAKTDSITKTKIAKQYNLDPQTLRDADGKMPIEVKAIVGTVNQVNTENAIKQDAVMQREQRVKELDKEYKESNDPQQRIELLKERDNLKKEIEHIEGKEAPAESVKDNVKDGIEQGIANKTEQVAQNATESVLSNTESNSSESDIQTRPEYNVAESGLKIDERTSTDKEVEVETNPQMDVTKQDSKDENNINDNKSDIEPADKENRTNREESVQKQELTPENFDGRKNPDDMTRFEMEQELGTKGGRISNLKKAVIKSRKSEIEDIKRRESGVNRLSELESEGKLNNVSELDNDIKDSNIEQSNADYETQLKQEQEQLAKQKIEDNKSKKVNDLTHDEVMAELNTDKKLSKAQARKELKAQRERIAKSEQAEIDKVERAKRRERRNKDRNKVLKDPKEMTVDEMKAELNVTEGTRGQLHRDIKKKRKQDAEAVDTETKVKQEKAKPKKSKKEKKPVVDNKVDAEKYAESKKIVDEINSRKPVSKMTLDELNAELGTESKSLARMRVRVETSRKKELAKAVKQQTINEPTTRARTPLEKLLRGDFSNASKAVKSLTNKDLSRKERSQAANDANEVINDMIKKIDPAIRKEMKIPKLNIKSNMKVETIDKKIREAIVNIRKAENKQRKVTAIKDFNKVAKDAIKLTKTKDRRGIVVNPIEAKKLDLRAQLIKEGKSNRIPNRLMDTLLKVADGQVDVTGLTANQINVLTNQIKKAAKSTKYEIKLAQQYSNNKIKAQALVFAEQVRGKDKQKTSQEIERERTGIKSKAKGIGKQFLDMVRIVRRQTGTKDSIMEKVMVDDIRDGEARMYNHQNNMNEDLGQMTEGYNVDKARTKMVYEKNGVKYTKSSLMAIEAYAQSKTGMDRLVLTDGILSKSSIDVLKPHIAEINGLKQEIDSIKYDKDGHKRTPEELKNSNDDIKLLALNEQMKELRVTKDADILKARQEAEAVVNDLRSQLTAKEKQIVNDFITMAETKMYDISNDAYQSINGGRELGRRERYFKFKNMNRDSDATTVDALSDVNGIQQYGRRGEGGLDTGFTKEIVKNPVGFKDTFSMDFFGIANEMITDSSRYSGMALPYISASKFLKEVKPTLDNLDASTHGVLKGYLDNVIRGKANGNDSTLDKVASSAMGLHALRTLGMSPKIMLMQGPSVLLALPHSSVKHLTIASTKAMADFTTGGFIPSKSKFVQNVYTKDPTMKARSGNIETVLADSKRILTEASKSSDSKIANGARETLLFLNKIGEAGMAGITYVDAYASSTVWTAAYDYAISKGKSEVDAIRAGRRAVTETQPMSDMLSRSGIQQAGLLIKALTPYASQRKQLSNMYADVFDPRSGLSKLERVKTIVALGTSQTLITGLQNGHYAGVALLAGMATNAMLGGPDASDEQKMLASDYMIDLVADGLAAPVTSIPGGGVLDSLIMKGADTTRKSMGIKTKNDWILKHREVGSTLIGSIFNQVYKGIDGAQESGTKGDKLGSAGQIIEALSVFQGMAINNMTRPYKNFKELSKTGDVRYIFYSKYITDKAREAEAKGKKVDMEFIRRNTLDYKTKAAKEIKTQKDLDKLYIKALSQ